MPEEYAPPVVAVVVVTAEVGASLEACVGSLANQDYPSLDTLVVDAGPGESLASRVAAAMPGAFVRRREPGGSFASAANDALQGVEGATFFLFCHDDVALAPDAVRLLVEESFRSNAAIVGPKLVTWDDPDRLLQVGIGVNRFGRPVPRVEEGELDQSQHDEVREVFAVPSACMLARVDLFAALRGFDADMGAYGEDIDLCWRARTAGARVVVVPQARVRHRQATAIGERPVENTQTVLRSNELRAVLKNYSPMRRLVAVFELALLTILETLAAPLTDRRERAWSARAAWRWNLAHRTSLREARYAARETRQVSDRVVVASMTRRGILPGALRPVAHGAATRRTSRQGSIYSEMDRLTDWLLRVQHGEIPAGQLVAWIVMVLVALIGTRSLLFGPLPLIGDLVPATTAHRLLGAYFGGVSDPGWRGTQAGPTAFGMVGLLGTVLGNSSALVLKILYLSGLFVGTIGTWRLLRDFGSSRGRIVAAVAFAASPLVWNALSSGDLSTSVALAGLPFVIGRLARASGLRPFVGAHGAAAPSWKARSLLPDIAPLGVLLAVLGALSPPTLIDVAVIVMATLVACLAAGGTAGVLRSALVGAGALVVAFVCCLPWSLTWVQPGARWSLLAGAVPLPAHGLSAASLLRGNTGPVGHWWGAFGLVAAAGFVFLWARAARFAWAIRWWACAVAAVLLAWLGGQGWLGAGGGDAGVLAAPAAVTLAACCGLAAASFELDIRKYRFGWRQVTGVLAAACFVFGVLPALAVVPAGRGGLPSIGFGETSGEFLTPAPNGFRALWIGDPRTLPGSAFQISPGVAGFVTTTGLPSTSTLWPSPNPGPADEVAGDLNEALAGRTLRLGALLAPYGIRDVVVPTANAPVLAGVQSAPRAALVEGFVQSLESQNDLRALPEEDGVMVFANADWVPSDGDGLVGGNARASSVPRDLGLAAGLLVSLAALSEGIVRRRARRDRRGRGGRRVGVQPLSDERASE
jgi:GT2 family glycosyltransferase